MFIKIADFMFKLFFVVLIGLAFGFTLAKATKAEGASDAVNDVPTVAVSECTEITRFPLASLQVAFAITYPESEQGVLSNKTFVDAYLNEYNNFGPNKTDFSGDEIFQNITLDGTILSVVLRDGLSCSRFIVGATLNKVITKTIARTTM